MISIKTISKRCGLSIATISRYMNGKGHVSEEAGLAIKEAIQELGYKPNHIARSLVTQKTNVIGVLVPSLSSSFLAGFVEGVERSAVILGYSIFLCHCHEDEEKEKKYLKLLQERRVDGIIAIPVTSDPQIYKDVAKNTPLILAIRKFSDMSFSSIVVDDFSGAYKCVDYLIKKGHKKIAFINGPYTISTGFARWEGAKAALRDNGQEYDESLVFENKYTIKSAYHSTITVLESGNLPTAFFAANQMLCIGIVQAVREKGYIIPEDISLVSFDGFEDSSVDGIIIPAITANYNPVAIVGEMSAEVITEEISFFLKKQQNKVNISSARQICIKLDFIERDSVRSI